MRMTLVPCISRLRNVMRNVKVEVEWKIPKMESFWLEKINELKFCDKRSWKMSKDNDLMHLQWRKYIHLTKLNLWNGSLSIFFLKNRRQKFYFFKTPYYRPATYGSAFGCQSWLFIWMHKMLLFCTKMSYFIVLFV